jgi:hypothetical protein
MENDCFQRTLKFKMTYKNSSYPIDGYYCLREVRIFEKKKD